jgi:hypothetical protein
MNGLMLLPIINILIEMSCLKALIPISEQSTHILQLNIKVLVKKFFERTILRPAILEQTILTTYSFRTNYFNNILFSNISFSPNHEISR